MSDTSDNSDTSDTSSPARGIQLRRYGIAQANHWYLHGFRIRIEVAAVTGGMPADVFVYRRPPVDPATGQPAPDQFLTVASFPDLAEYPAKNPDDATTQPFFRNDCIELDVRSTEEYNDIWTVVKSQVAALVTALNLADNLQLQETLWLGDEPASDVSDSA